LFSWAHLYSFGYRQLKALNGSAALRSYAFRLDPLKIVNRKLLVPKSTS